MAFAWLFVQTFRILNNLSASFVDIWCCLNHFKVFFKSMRLIYFLPYGWWHFRCTHSTRPQTHFFLYVQCEFYSLTKSNKLKDAKWKLIYIKMKYFPSDKWIEHTVFTRQIELFTVCYKVLLFLYITRTTTKRFIVKKNQVKR